MNPAARVLRSYLFAPANHERRREKAFECGADAVILDLEDAVPPGEKDAARRAVSELLTRPRPVAAYVRVNAFDSAWCYRDLQAVVRPGLAGVVLPKAESATQLQTIDWCMTQLEREGGIEPGSIELLALVETARGVAALAAMAAATPRVKRLSFGIADYSLDLGLRPGPDEAEIAYIRARLVHDSRVAGLEPPVDSVVVQVRDAGLFHESATRARRLGLFGKLCIHPDQVAAANEVFAPTAGEIEAAQAVVAAFEKAEASGSAAIEVDGDFVDYPVVARARGLLELAGRIAGPADA